MRKKNIIDEILSDSKKIPALPKTVFEIINIDDNDYDSLKKVVNNIKKDQGLTAALLRFVNSPLYAVPTRIDSIDRCIVLLGLNEIKRVVFSISIKAFYEKDFYLYNESGLRLWMHSYNVANISLRVGKSYKYLKNNSLFLAGLMHDIGKVFIVDYLYAPVKSYDDEKKQIGYTHMEIGAYILKKWGVSEDVVQAVKNHHHITDSIFNKIIYFANKLEKSDNVNNKIYDIFKEYMNKY
ncbi:MAG: HDOD domain-containing protein [Deferribacterota bacterium]|nr:HDOD domain-containing protein [Deferribacterota bacterium]